MYKRKVFFFTNDGIASKLINNLRLSLGEVLLFSKKNKTQVKVNDLFNHKALFVFFSINYLTKSRFLNSNIPFFNIHPSVIPKNIGPTPLNNVVLTKLRKTGISLLKMNVKVDFGVLLNKIKFRTFRFESFLYLKNKVGVYSTIMSLLIINKNYEYVQFKNKRYTLTKKENNYSMLSKWEVSKLRLKSKSRYIKLYVILCDSYWKFKNVYVLKLSYFNFKFNKLFVLINYFEKLPCLNNYGFLYKNKGKLLILKTNPTKTSALALVFI